MENTRTLEMFILALVLALGVPVCALLGARDGERLAAAAFPPKAAAPAGEDLKPEDILASEATVALGARLFQQNCVSCHGPNADGKGAAAAALVPPPRNFQDPGAKWTRSREPADIFKTVTEGSPGTAMPPFGAAFKPRERWALAAFIGSQAGVRGKFKPLDAAAAASLAAGKAP